MHCNINEIYSSVFRRASVTQPAQRGISTTVVFGEHDYSWPTQDVWLCCSECGSLFLVWDSLLAVSFFTPSRVSRESVWSSAFSKLKCLLCEDVSRLTFFPIAGNNHRMRLHTHCYPVEELSRHYLCLYVCQGNGFAVYSMTSMNCQLCRKLWYFIGGGTELETPL